MKVLHLPSNIASQISVTVRALRDTGIDARAIVRKDYAIQDSTFVEVAPQVTASRFSPKRLFQKAARWKSVLAAVRWADVIHWHYSSRILPADIDLKYISFLKKPAVVEFWGSDIRIPEAASSDNPYTERMYREHPEFAHGKTERSIKAQQRFARHGFQCIIPDFEMEPFVQKDSFPTFYKTRARIVISDFQPSYPSPEKQVPCIVHVPSNKGKKGTEAILKVVDRLKAEHTFDFKLIHGVEHSKAMQMVAECDIMIDELISGTYGLATCEAMAMGKPVVCYMKPAVMDRHPDYCPIVNANQDNIEEVLTELLSDAACRHRIGQNSRAYVEEFHDAHKQARNLIEIYKDLIERKKTST